MQTDDSVQMKCYPILLDAVFPQRCKLLYKKETGKNQGPVYLSVGEHSQNCFCFDKIFGIIFPFKMHSVRFQNLNAITMGCNHLRFKTIKFGRVDGSPSPKL